MEYLEIGCSPADEKCVQVGEHDYRIKARQECERYIQAIRNKCGKEPEGASLAVKVFRHEFGDYLEVVCYYSTPEGEEYAYKVESEAPVTWKEGGIYPTNYLPCPVCEKDICVCNKMGTP